MVGLVDARGQQRPVLFGQCPMGAGVDEFEYLLNVRRSGVDGWAFRATQRSDPAMRDVPTVIVRRLPPVLN